MQKQNEVIISIWRNFGRFFLLKNSFIYMNEKAQKFHISKS